MIVDTKALPEFRRVFVEWMQAAVRWGKGRTVDDRFYQSIVEGRDKGPRYSSCADLAHWGLERIGCREPWCNRAALKQTGPGLSTHPGYRSGLNVNLLVPRPTGANPYAEPVASRDEERRRVLRSLQPGDIMITWTGNGNNAHVCVFEFYDGAIVHSFDLGQGPMSVDAWAPNKRDHLEARQRQRARGYFPLRSVLRLDQVPRTGELDLPSGERLEAMGAYDGDQEAAEPQD